MTLIALNSWSQDFVSFENSGQEYIFLDEAEYPSCLIAKHRAKERAKVLREYKHHAKKNPHYKDFFFVNDYLMNKYFLDESLWVDEVVVVRNAWRIPPDQIEALANTKDSTYFWLKGDGVDWVERQSLFPEDVIYQWDLDNSRLVTFHKAYYYDYCFPQLQPQLTWFPGSNNSLQSTKKMIEDFLKHEKGENQ